MKILTEKQRLKILKQLAAIRHISTHLIFEDDRETRIEYVDKAIENVADIAFDVCGKEAATVGMSQLMYHLQELDKANGTPMGYTAKDKEKTIDKADLVKYLMQKDENVIKLAIAYAENLRLYGVDVTRAWETAVEQAFALHAAEKRGYYKCMESIRRREDEDT